MVPGWVTVSLSDLEQKSLRGPRLTGTCGAHIEMRQFDSQRPRRSIHAGIRKKQLRALEPAQPEPRSASKTSKSGMNKLPTRP